VNDFITRVAAGSSRVPRSALMSSSHPVAATAAAGDTFPRPIRCVASHTRRSQSGKVRPS